MISFLLSAPSFATAFSMRVVPDTISPGDLFYVEVRSDESASAYVRFNGKEIRLYRSSGDSALALVPVGMDTPPGEYSVEVIQGGTHHARTVRVEPKSFRTIELTLPDKTVSLSKEDQMRVEREYILQQKIWRKSSGIKWRGPFTHPLENGISTEFGVRRIMNKKKTSIHRGIDFRGKAGAPVKSINSGRVVLVRELFYGGNTVVIDHGMGLYSVYMHLSKIDVEEGREVEKGEVIGRVGMSGRATGPHLHLSVKLNGESVNPESLFRLKL